MTTPAQLGAGPLKFGDHVGHRDRTTWWNKHIPGRVVEVDATQDPPRIRVHPTRYNGPDWEAPADDLVRLGYGLAAWRGGYALGAHVQTMPGHPVDAVAPNGTTHRVVVPPSMVVDAYVTDADRVRYRVRTDADGTLWDVAHADLMYVTPRQ